MSTPLRGDGAGDAANREIVEGRHRIGLRPQTDPARLETSVTVVEEQLAVEPGLHVVTECHHSHGMPRSEEHTSELQSLAYLVCRLLLEKKKNIIINVLVRQKHMQVRIH